MLGYWQIKISFIVKYMSNKFSDKKFLENAVWIWDLLQKWSWLFGNYYEYSKLNKYLKRKWNKSVVVWVKTFQKRISVLINLQEEFVLKRRTHNIIQQARKDAKIPQWITSIDVFWNVERVLKRKAIFQEHISWLTFDEFRKDKWLKYRFFWLKKIAQKKLKKIGIIVSDFHGDNIMLDDEFVCAFEKARSKWLFLLLYQHWFIKEWHMYVNIDPDRWEIIEPQNQILLSLHL